MTEQDRPPLPPAPKVTDRNKDGEGTSAGGLGVIEENDMKTVTAAADKAKTTRKGLLASKSAKTLFNLIREERWDDVLCHLSYYELDAKEWIEEVNDDGSKRWKSLPIHLVCERKPPMEVVSQLVLISPGSLTVKNYGEDLPLHVACREGACKEVIEFLLQKNYNTASKTDCEGRLPLHLAVSHPNIHVKTLNDLILFYEKAPRTPDDFGLLPLHYACMKKASPAVIEALLKANPYATEHRDSYGRLPMDLAKQKPKLKHQKLELLVQTKNTHIHMQERSDPNVNANFDPNINGAENEQRRSSLSSISSSSEASSHDARAKTVELLSRDPSSWTNAMMSTIVSLSHKVHAAQAMEKDFETRVKQMKVLMDQNARSDQEVLCLQHDLTLLERHFEAEIRIIQNDHHRQLATLCRERDDIDRRSDDLKTLVEELVEQLKDETTRVEDQGMSRKDLKEKVVSLIQHLEAEKQNVIQIQEEQDVLLDENSEIMMRVEEKECELDEWRAREEELVKALRREQQLGEIMREEKDKTLMMGHGGDGTRGFVVAGGGMMDAPPPLFDRRDPAHGMDRDMGRDYYHNNHRHHPQQQQYHGHHRRP